MRELRKPELKKTIIISALALLVVAVAVVWIYALGDRPSPETQDTTGTVSSETVAEPEEETPPETGEGNAEKSEVETEAPDPSLFSSIEVSHLDIEVFYTKGVPGFSYQILRTPAGTQYVEFSSEDLIGTKCTDDSGVFASILKNPSSSEDSTVTSTTKIGTDSYGLSLASNTCTGDSSLLSSYQTAFKNGFSSLQSLSDDQ